MPIKLLTESDIEFIKVNYSTKGAKFCSEELSINRATIVSAAYRLGLKVNKDVLVKFSTKDVINIHDYTNVTDPKIAYILGLIWTDGYVGFANNKSKTPVIKHSCVAYDSESSDLIFKSLNWRHFYSENKKSIGKNTMSMNWVSSRDLGDYLISENYRNKKIGTYIYDNFKELTSHFLRGVLDGDGCITISNIGKKYKQTAISFSSSVEQDWSFISKILDSINVSYGIRKLVDKRGESSQLYIRNSLSIYNLCEFIYKDSDDIRLERKYQKYMDFLDYKILFKRNNILEEILNTK